MSSSTDKRWLALYILCLGVLMIVLDTTIVNVALPSIKADLGFADNALAWIVNAYMLTSGGFLLLGGRLGDLYGSRKWFLVGITLFTVASAACGLASSQLFLIIMRADLEMLYDQYPRIERLGRKLAEQVAITSENHLFSLLNYTAAERYEQLRLHHPEFIRQIPVQYLASYLGITRETLSRIRKKG